MSSGRLINWNTIVQAAYHPWPWVSSSVKRAITLVLPSTTSAQRHHRQSAHNKPVYDFTVVTIVTYPFMWSVAKSLFIPTSVFWALINLFKYFILAKAYQITISSNTCGVDAVQTESQSRNTHALLMQRKRTPEDVQPPHTSLTHVRSSEPLLRLTGRAKEFQVGF